MIMTADLLRLLMWLSPSFPTGAFAYSHGLEWSVEAGDIRSERQLRGWVDDLLRNGSPRGDAILLRHAYRAAGSAGVKELIAFALALPPARERLVETQAQGAAFALAAAPWGAGPELAEAPYPVCVGALAACNGIDEDLTAAAYLQAVAGNLVSAAIRLIPLGQSAGLRVMAALEATILSVVGETRSAGLDDIGTACFRSDIAAMRHETQYTRLFRT